MSTLDSLQQTLAGEHAAVYVYGVLGGRAAVHGAQPLRRDLTACYQVHVTRRDDLRLQVTAAGAVPVAAEPAYRLPPSLTTLSQIAAEAWRTEHACVGLYAALVAAAIPGVTRTWAVSALAASAVTELDFGGSPQALPGVTVAPTAQPSTVAPSS
jgi:Domain of unknown function (DUF4439)